MKIIKYLALTVAMAAALTTASAQIQFSVTGYGRVFYEPASYDLSFGVVTDNVDVQRCKEAHLAAMNNVKEWLDRNKEKIISLKQDATHLQTIYLDNSNRSKSFRFTTAYVARVKDVATLLPMQEGLISAGVTDIYSLDTFSEKLPELAEKARKEAIADAQSKAKLAAPELGWTLKGASNISFEEGSPYGESRASVQYGVRSYAYDPTKRPETTTSIESRVAISFAFEYKK